MTEVTPSTRTGPEWSPATRRLVVTLLIAMGDSVLPPIIVLIAISAGLQVWGVLGAIIAAPVVATFKTLTRYLWNKAVPDAL